MAKLSSVPTQLGLGLTDPAAEPIEKKVRHVKKATQTRPHGCHWPGCTADVPPAMWGCREHWKLLPRALRTKIWRTYRIGQEETGEVSKEYVATAREVQTWIKTNYPPPKSAARRATADTSTPSEPSPTSSTPAGGAARRGRRPSP